MFIHHVFCNDFISVTILDLKDPVTWEYEDRYYIHLKIGVTIICKVKTSVEKWTRSLTVSRRNMHSFPGKHTENLPFEIGLQKSNGYRIKSYKQKSDIFEYQKNYFQHLWNAGLVYYKTVKVMKIQKTKKVSQTGGHKGSMMTEYNVVSQIGSWDT